MKTFLAEEYCPIRNTIHHLGDKWSILVLKSLSENGTLRFNELQKSIGDISHRMLTVTLRSLENNRLVERKMYAEIPPRVEYKLTELANTLIPHLNNLIQWAIENYSKDPI